MKIGTCDNFEYGLITFSGSSGQRIIDQLQKLGKEGWEITNISIEEGGLKKYIIKRRIKLYNIKNDLEIKTE